jgi:hypothetical protein
MIERRDRNNRRNKEEDEVSEKEDKVEIEADEIMGDLNLAAY